MNKRIWFVTGISSGLGSAISECVIRNNEFLIGTFRKQNQVDDFNRRYEGKGKAYLLDVTNQNQILEVLQNIKTGFGGIDVLVNNAGVGFVGAVEETSLEKTRIVFEANFFGALTISQQVAAFMREKGTGHIVQISSHGGVKSFAGFGIYNASKFALEGFSEAMAQELTPLGINLTIVEPGPFRTEFAGNGLQQAESIIDDYSETAGTFRTMLKGVHGKQEGDPQKAAEAIFRITKTDLPPLRLPLGKIPLKTIQMKIDALQDDLNKNREIAESVVYE
ncbi:MAG: oxidoreductase, partial [Balneolales bacterium]|nr:oxidoreductase [Balneolales bacterium]